MSGEMVRPHMGVKVGEEFVGQIKSLMVECDIDRDRAVSKMVNQSKTSQYQEAVILAYNQKMDKLVHDKCVAIDGADKLRRENRKLYMVIAILSVACVTLALM